MRFRKEFTYDDAVSPVIGVILMVAITVVLAAVVFVLVGSLTESTAESPGLGMVKNDQADTLTVSKLTWDGDPLYWNTVAAGDALVVSGCTTVNGNAIDGTDQVSAGDVLQCAPGQVTISHSLSQTLVYGVTFN